MAELKAVLKKIHPWSSLHYGLSAIDTVVRLYKEWIPKYQGQGSEIQVVIIPVLSQHFRMLYRNQIYTGLTRARKLAVFVGTRKALAMAIRQQDTTRRQTALAQLLRNGARSVDV